MMRAILCATSLSIISAQNTLVVSVGTQNGFFKSVPSDPAISGDIGPMNPHDYRPNEFVANDFIFEGLVEWDANSPNGVDGIPGNEDDYVSPSLATHWTTGYSGSNYVITFTLRAGVTFHDGSAWNSAAAVTNFDQIMGGTGTLGTFKALRGMHDWLGFTQVLDAWAAVDDMTFSLTFTSYYEAAFRELATIRPFRMSSVAALPSLANMELSHTAARNGALRNPWPPNCASKGLPCFMFRGVAAPIGTGPYRVVDKLLSSGRRLPASEFNATCYENVTLGIADRCMYNPGEYVKEVLFTKVAGHWKTPTYDSVILRAYDSQAAVSAALKDGSLDIAYGVNTLSQSAFISLATAESGSNVVAHQAQTDLNVRNVVINSGTIISRDMRKFVMAAIEGGRQALYDGELAEETPMDTLFDPTLPHCSVLSNLSTPAALAADRSPDITAANFSTPLRLLYRAYEPHSVVIAAEVQARLYAAGIQVTPIPVQTRDAYNSFNCDYLDGFSYGGSALAGCDDGDADCLAQFHSWDLSLSQTWGPPYDPTSKLWDMTHLWCSGESDAPAVINMETMSFSQFRTNVRALSTTQDKTARENLYASVLTTLHDEAIFLPITAKRQTAVTNARVSGFRFGYMEFDLPLANLYPTAQTGPYPVTYTSCGVTHTLTAAPNRVVTMNQGVTEFMLAMGLGSRMVGTAYLDDAIWPRYAAAYNSIPVLSSGYPTEDQIIRFANADFVLGSYRSAFRERLPGSTRGIFSNATVGPCDGEGSDYFPTGSNTTGSYSTCRPQLHAAGIGTWLEPVSCEDSALRPTGGANEETVYAAIRQIGAIFNVPTLAESLITEMRTDFDIAEQTVQSYRTELDAVWLDCVGCCDDPNELFVGGGAGAPNLLMVESGLTNVFSDRDASWTCVTVEEVLAANVDVVIIVDASWDSAIEKIDYLHNHTDLCNARWVQQADYITIPFSASTLGPRNGAAALDLAAAAIHVTTGDVTMNFQSGVSFFSPELLVNRTRDLQCPVAPENVAYAAASTRPPPPPADSTYTFSVVAAGSVADFDSAKVETIKGSIADKAGVPTTAVTVSILAASVNIIVNIATPPGSNYASVANRVDSYLTSEAQATELLGGSSVVTVVELSAVPVPFPMSSGDDLPGWGVALIALFSVGFSFAIAFAFFMYSREMEGKPIFSPMDSKNAVVVTKTATEVSAA